MDTTALASPTTPRHPWWCADIDDDPHTDQPHHSEFEGVVDEARRTLVGVGLRQSGAGPVLLHVSVANDQGAEADVMLSLGQAAWLWRTLGVVLLQLDPNLWVPHDLTGDPYLTTGTPPSATRAFGPMTEPPVHVAVRPKELQTQAYVILTVGPVTGKVPVGLTMAQAVLVWRHVTSYLKRLGVLPCLE